MAHLRSLATVSGFTAISRVLGFLRDVMIARFIGANLVTDAFFTAFRLPNMFRRIFGEGAFNAAFVPLFAKKLEGEGKEKAVTFGSQTFSMLTLVLGIGTVIAVPAMGWIMSLVAPGFKAKYDSDWVAVGTEWQQTETVPVGGAKQIFLVSRGEGTRLEFRSVDLVDPAGKKVPLATFLTRPAESEGDSILVGEASPALTLEGEDMLTVPLPSQHEFTGLQFGGVVSGMGEARFEIYRNHPKTFPLTVALGRITFIYLLCMALTAHLSGVLNTVRIFGMPAAAPIILNVIFLIGLFFFVGIFGFSGGYVLAWCVFVAGFVQLGALWWTAWREGYAIRIQRPTITPEMKRLFLLMGPGILSAGIQQINLLVGGIIASNQENAVSYLYYSERIYQLPLGMVGIAFGVVLLPDITRKLRAKRPDEANESLNRGIEYALLITLPATVALLVIAYPIISGIFEWGEHFTASKSALTAPALSAFALGLPGYVLIKVLQPGYFAREDTKTPMYIAGITVVTNIVFSLLLFWWLRPKGIGHVGIALATSIAAWVNVVLLGVGLRRRGYIKLDRRLMDKFWRIGISSSMMGLILLFLYSAIEGYLLSGRWQCLISLTVLVGVGLVSFLASAFTLGATSMTELRHGFRRG